MSGRPASECSILGSGLFIRVPRPAARMIAESLCIVVLGQTVAETGDFRPGPRIKAFDAQSWPVTFDLWTQRVANSHLLRHGMRELEGYGCTAKFNRLTLLVSRVFLGAD